MACPPSSEQKGDRLREDGMPGSKAGRYIHTCMDLYFNSIALCFTVFWVWFPGPFPYPAPPGLGLPVNILSAFNWRALKVVPKSYQRLLSVYSAVQKILGEFAL